MTNTTAEQHRKAKELFLQACAKPPGERAAWVAQACSDGVLRAEVERLLAYHIPAPVVEEAKTRVPRILDLDREVKVTVRPSATAELPSFGTGVMVAGRYRIVSLLGEGAMGRVYRADDTRLNQQVALKFLPRQHVLDPAWRKRVEREVRLSREISHPNICRVYDLGDVDGSPFISMEFVGGEDLASLLRRVGRLTGDRAVEIARQICAGLAAAHIHGVLHRDLKPANIMLDADGRVRITDFGLAVLVGQIDAGEIRAGTPRYMAPEQISGISVTERSDIYSLGLVLYELFTGERAFDAPQVRDYVQLHRSVDPPAPSSIVPEIDPKVEAVIMACLHKDPSERPESALCVAAALPGGDLLAAALAAGQIPTREMLAQAAATGQTNRPSLIRLMTAAFILFGAAVLCGRDAHPVCQNGGAKSPDALGEIASQLLVRCGFESSLLEAESRFRFATDEELLSFIPPEIAETGQLPMTQPDGVIYCYSQSRDGPRTVVSDLLAFVMPGAESFRLRSSLGVVSTVILDDEGRPLLLYSRAPPAPTAKRSTGPLDLESLVMLAGYDPATLAAFETSQSSASGASHRSAYRVRRDSANSAAQARIEISGNPSDIDGFAILAIDDAGTPNPFSAQTRYRAARTFRNLILLILLAVGIPNACINARRGGDHVGAARLGLFVMGLRFFVSILSMPPVSAPSELVETLATGAISALCEGLIISAFYLAIESHVRGLWPRTLGGWSRVLAGKFRDPFVGRDLLAGCLVGCFWAIIAFVDLQLPKWMGWEGGGHQRFMKSLEYVMGTRYALAGVFGSIRSGIYQGLVVLFLLAMFTRIAGRHRRAALIATWAVCSSMFSLGLSQFVTTWVLVSFGCVAIGLILLIRWGLLSLLAALFVLNLLTVFPITANLATWYSGFGLFAVLCVAVLMIWSAAESLRPPASETRFSFAQ